MQHNVEQLGASGFQDLSAALAVKVCGDHVQVLGSGRDGGRDMYCNGVIVWSGNDDGPGEVWDGYTVFQAKHKERLDAVPMRNAKWLWSQVKGELDKWADPAYKRNPVPNYLVIITNVPLTPTPETGGLALLNRNIADYVEALADDRHDIDDDARKRRETMQARMSRLRAWRVWDGNQIDAYLTVHGDVRRAFAAFLTAADVFANLAECTDKLPLAQLEPGLRRHARTSLVGERFLYFDEAGAGDGTGTPIEEVVIDLPIVSRDNKKRTVLGQVFDRGERVLKPRLSLYEGPRHLVVAGGPGNGKTTVARFLVQSYRAALLDGASDLGADHRSVISATRETQRRLGRAQGLPSHRRWPIRIDLAEYVEEGGLSEESTLLRWIAHKVSQRSNAGQVTPSALDSWMRQWPWLLVLDGLDEVTEPITRKRLIRQITEFVTDAEGDNCDLFVVLTTRPTGYVENIAPTQFERVDLSRLDAAQAVSYGIRAAKVRLRDDVDKIERIENQLRRAAADESLRNLMQTPLQVLIMTIIVEGSGRLSPDRYSLFWGYYETVFKRERTKQGPSSRLLQEQAPHILHLHQRVGFELQRRSEEAEGSTATMTPEELRLLAWQVLDEAGYKPSDADSALLDAIVTAATHRLVLLAPRGEEGLGFDVRSLQELMAARYLTTGTIEEAARRLEWAAASPHWRNSWIFAAGRYFSEPQAHQQESVVRLVEGIDRDAAYRLGRICPIGPALALDLIDDGMARSQPRFHDRLLAEGLRVLRSPQVSDPLAVARVLVRAAEINDRSRGVVATALRGALTADPLTRQTASDVQRLTVVAGKETGMLHPFLLAGIRGKSLADETTISHDEGWEQFDVAVTTYPDTDEILAKVEPAAESLRRLGKADDLEQQSAAIVLALSDPEAAAILETALESVACHEPGMVVALHDHLLPTIHRAPVGDALRYGEASGVARRAEATT